MSHARQVNDIFVFIELIVGIVAVSLQMALELDENSQGRFFIAAPLVIEKDQF